MPSASTVDKKPFLWDAGKALDFPSIWDLICQNHPDGHPVSRETIACIFFEETCFCNRKQQPGPAVGFGQMQIYDKDKIPFFADLGYNSDQNNHKSDLPLITYKMVTDDHNLSVDISCAYFQWLVMNGKSREGALMAQTGGGGNETFVPLFIEGGNRLAAAMSSGERSDYTDALNYAKANGRHHNPVPFSGNYAFTKFWEFVIPDEYLGN
jgi:hypothetical protein